jgi:hypothetical protein
MRKSKGLFEFIDTKHHPLHLRRQPNELNYIDSKVDLFEFHSSPELIGLYDR